MTDSPPNVRIHNTIKELTEDAGMTIRRSALEAVEARGGFTIALSGGRTPLPLYKWLAGAGPALPYEKMRVFWSDERAVPPDHPQSNYRLAWDAWLSAVPADSTRIHRIRGEDDPETAATAYEQLLHTTLGDPPIFDLILLGMGSDGHIASLFPRGPEVHSNRLVVASRAPVSPRRRITMTLRVILAGRQIMVLATGSEKSQAVRAALEGPQTDAVPASLLRAHPQALWFLDLRAAAALRLSAVPRST
jgi:6-phosphogluconolactonase